VIYGNIKGKGGINLRRIVIITCLLMLCFGTSVASDVTTDLLEKYVNMTYNTDAGINRLDYGKEYRILYVETQKAKDKLDAQTYESFNEILMMYNDAKYVCQEHYPVVNYDAKSDLQKKYPEIKTKVTQDIWGNYDTRDVMSYIWVEADKKTKELQKKYKKESI
jgi:hypothetical protein